MADQKNSVDRKADDIRIGLSFWIIIALCTVACLASTTLWVISDDPTMSDCASVAACVFAVLLVLLVVAAKGEATTNKILRDTHIDRDEKKTD